MKFKTDNFKGDFRLTKNFLIISIVAIIASVVFVLYNQESDNVLIDFVTKNIWCQGITTFLTITGLINIFYPFSLRIELKRRDVENISRKTITQEREKEKNDKRIEESATY